MSMKPVARIWAADDKPPKFLLLPTGMAQLLNMVNQQAGLPEYMRFSDLVWCDSSLFVVSPVATQPSNILDSKSNRESLLVCEFYIEGGVLPRVEKIFSRDETGACQFLRSVNRTKKRTLRHADKGSSA